MSGQSKPGHRLTPRHKDTSWVCPKDGRLGITRSGSCTPGSAGLCSGRWWIKTFCYSGFTWHLLHHATSRNLSSVITVISLDFSLFPLNTVPTQNSKQYKTEEHTKQGWFKENQKIVFEFISASMAKILKQSQVEEDFYGKYILLMHNRWVAPKQILPNLKMKC